MTVAELDASHGALKGGGTKAPAKNTGQQGSKGGLFCLAISNSALTFGKVVSKSQSRSHL